MMLELTDLQGSTFLLPAGACCIMFDRQKNKVFVVSSVGGSLVSPLNIHVKETIEEIKEQIKRGGIDGTT